jgi:fatty acid-binding protein DegV
MDSLLFDMGVSFILTAIKAAFKNEEKKEALKKALLKIKTQIEILYPEE